MGDYDGSSSAWVGQSSVPWIEKGGPVGLGRSRSGEADFFF